MKTIIAILLLVPAFASAQIAATDAWVLNGTVNIQGKAPTVFDHTQAIQHEASFEPYDQANTLNNWSSNLIHFELSQSHISFDGPVNPIDVKTGTSLRNWELRIETQQHELLVLSLPYLGSYANVKGNCPNDLSSFTGLDIHDAKLTINGDDVPLPALPDEDTVVPLNIGSDIGDSTGELTLRAPTRNDDNSDISVVAFNLQVEVTQGDTSATVDLQIGYGHANLDCLHVPVELQSWEVD